MNFAIRHIFRLGKAEQRFKILPLLLFFGMMSSSLAFGAKPQFAELPGLFFPATNILQAGGSEGESLPVSATNVSQLVLTNGMESLNDKYRLAIGDRLSFRIVEDEDPPKPLLVMDSGELEVPYIGRFPAVGKTCLVLARAIKAELEKEYYFRATIIVAVDSMRTRGKVYLVGPVRSPGPQDIPTDEVLTLSKAIIRAGGLSDFADGRKVRVTRTPLTASEREQTFTVNVEEVLEKGRIQSDLPLQAGDLIIIPERLIRF